MAKLRNVTPHQMDLIKAAVAHLMKARDHLRTAGAKNASAYVARALKSAQGAQSHAHRALDAMRRDEAVKLARRPFATL